MRLVVELRNITKHAFTKKRLGDIFKQTIAAAELNCLDKKDLEVSVAFVSEREIQEINRRYRKKDAPTDILSFAEHESAEDFCGKEISFDLGELIVSGDYIENSARDRGIPFEDEAVYVLSHGLLHLLGFSHGKKMYAIQQEVVDKLMEKK